MAGTTEVKESKTVWDETREVFLQRGQANEEQSQFVCVNGRTFLVPKGKNVAVPLPVYEALMNARRAEEEAFQRAKNES